MKSQQALCHNTESPSGRPASSARSLPEREHALPSLRPTELKLQRQQANETAVKTQARNPDLGILTSNHSENFCQCLKLISLKVNLHVVAELTALKLLLRMCGVYGGSIR